jgi:hypothetical protein
MSSWSAAFSPTGYKYGSTSFVKRGSEQIGSGPREIANGTIEGRVLSKPKGA